MSPDSPAILSLSQRGRDLLDAVRRDQRRRSPTSSAGLLPLAYLLAAEEGIDGELSALALARRMAAAGGGARPVALLMLDPLGATLRTIGPSAPPTRAPRLPQRRAADRPEWEELLNRIPESTRMLLVLDLTGGQHNLETLNETTTIVFSRTSAEGRVAAYRKLKELPPGPGDSVALFFVDDPPDAQVRPYIPLTQRADATFQRLRDAAAQFLQIRVCSLGSASEPDTDGLRVELLGQRPSLNGRENRSGLTCWLAERCRPALCDSYDRQPVEQSDLPSAEPDGPGGPAFPPVTAAKDCASVGSCVDRPPRAAELLTADELADLLPTGRPAVEPPASRKFAPSRHDFATPQPDCPQDCSADDTIRGLPVAAGDAAPGDSMELADLLAGNPRLLGANSALGFRPPANRSAVLLACADGSMLIAGGTGFGPAATGGTGFQPVVHPSASQIEQLCRLADCIIWAEQHWPLLKLAYPQAGLADKPACQCLFVCVGDADEGLRSLAARLNVRLVRMIELDLSKTRGTARGLAVIDERSPSGRG